MYQESNQNPQRKGVSHVQKRQILWNIIEPGDPYDIKKSMIAKLPGDRRNFMGAHIELVCLLQAAEIERLCEYLQQYKLRYRQVQRRQLDRHSYQIQIKELTMQLADQNSFKSQNLKLREFLKKQTNQLQDLRKKAGSNSDFERNYQKLLIQFENIRSENNGLINQRRLLISDIDQLRAQINAMQNAHRKEIEHLKIQFSDSSKIAFDRERRELMMKFESEISRLQYDNKRLKDSNDAKNREIQQLQYKFRQVYSQLEDESVKNQKFSLLQSTVKQYQKRFSLVGQEIQRLNLVLRDKTNELNELYNRYRQFEIEVQRKDSTINEYQIRIKTYEVEIHQFKTTIRRLEGDLEQSNQNVTVIKDYENRLQLLSKQIERLNDVLRRKVDQNAQLIRKLSEYQYEIQKIELVSKQNYELKDRTRQYQQVRRKMAEYQNKLAIVTGQIQRLNQVLRSKVQTEDILNNKNRALFNEIQMYKSKITEMEQSLNYDMQNRIRSYEQRISSMTQQIEDLRRNLKQSSEKNRLLSEYENRLNLLSQEIERLNGNLRVKVDQINKMELNNRNQLQQIQNYKRRLNEIESNYGTQLKTKISNYEIKITQMSRRLQQYENKIALLSQEIERLNVALKSKVEDLNNYEQRNRILQNDAQMSKRKISELQYEISNGWKGKLTGMQQRLTQMQQENEQLKRRIKELSDVTRKISEYESKIMQLSSEVERLNSMLEKYTKDKNQIVNQNEQLRANINGLQGRLDQLINENKRIVEELRLSQESVRNYSGQINQLSLKITQIIAQRDDLNRKVGHFSEEDASVRRRIQQYESKMATLSQQIQRLNKILRAKVDQLSGSQKRVQSLSQELESIRIKFTQSETHILQQFRSKIVIFERDNQQLKRKLAEYENKMALMSSQIQRLNQALKLKVDEINSQEQRYRSLNQQFEKFKNSQVKGMSQENEDLKRKLGQYDRRMGMMSEQIERLNSNLKIKVQELVKAQGRIRQLDIDLDSERRKGSQIQNSVVYQMKSKITIYEQKIITYTQQNEELRRRLNDLENGNRKLAQYQSRIAILGQEIERLNSLLKGKVDELSIFDQRNRGMQQEIDNLKRRLGESQVTIVQEWRSRYSSLEGQFSNLQRENDQLKRRLKETNDLHRKISQYENKIVHLSQEIDQLNNLLIKYEKDNSSLADQNRRISEFQQKITLLSKQIQRLNNNLRSKVDQLNIAQQKIRSLNSQNDSLKRRIGETQTSIVQQFRSKISIYEQQITVFTQQNEEMRRRIKELTDSNRRMADLQAKLALLTQQIERINQVLRSKVDELSLAEQRNRSLQQQLQNSQRRFNQNQGVIVQQWRSRVSIMEQEMASWAQQNDDLKRRIIELSDASRKVNEYQNRITLLAQQIERLNQALRNKVDQLSNFEQRYRSLQEQLQGSKRRFSQTETSMMQEWKLKYTTIEQQNEELKRRLRQLTDINRKLVDYQNKIAMMSQQIQRLNQMLKLKSDQFFGLQARFRTSQSELQSMVRRTKDMETSVVTEYQSRISIYQQKVSSITHDNQELRLRINQLLEGNKKLLEYENRLQMASQEIERLNQSLRSKSEELNSNQTRNRSLQQQVQNYRRRIGQMESSMSNEMRSKIGLFEQQAIDMNRKIAQYENKIAILNQQIDRINGTLRNSSEQNKSLDQQLRTSKNDLENARRRISEMQGSINNQLRVRITSFEQKITIYEQKLTVITQENQQMRVRIQSLSQFESKCIELGRQIERLNVVLRNMQRDSQSKYSNYERQIQQLRRRLNDAGEINRKIAQYESRIAIMSAQIQRLNQTLRVKVDELNGSENKLRNVQQQFDVLKRRFNQSAQGLEGKATKLMQQVQRLNIVLKEVTEKNYTYGSEIQGFKRKESQYLGDIQRLNNTLRLKVDEATRWKRQYDELIVRYQQFENRTNSSNSQFQKLQVAYNMIVREYQNSKKHLSQYEISIQRLYAQFQRLQTIMQDLKKQNHQLKQALDQKGGVHEKNRVLSAQIDRLNRIISELNEQIAELRIRMSDQVALQKRINQHMALMVILFAQIQSLRKRVRDKQQEVQEVRRSSLAPFKI